MKKFFTAMVLILTAVITLTFSGCGVFTIANEIQRDKKNASQELDVIWGRDGDDYVYSDKVRVSISLDSEFCDSLEVIKGKGEKTSWEVILEDDFEKVAWYDYKLFILVDRTYYMFDIKAYEPPEYSHNEPVYELKEYNVFQMQEMYPDYESFEWYETD